MYFGRSLWTKSCFIENSSNLSRNKDSGTQVWNYKIFELKQAMFNQLLEQMKRIKLSKTIMLISVVSLLFITAGCGSSKQAAGPVNDPNEVKLYCSGAQYMTQTPYLRANASGLSSDMEIARDKALTDARARLSSQIELFSSALTDFYKKDTRLNENEKMEKRFENMIREVFKNKMQGVYPICEKVMKEDGKFRAYVAVELGGKEMLENIASKLSSDQELKVDYDYDKFKKNYEGAMDQLEKDRGQ
jgi:hypothetical protein